MNNSPQAWRTAQIAALKGKTPSIGLDLGSTRDLTALALLFKLDDVGGEDMGYVVLPYFWVPRESALEREKRDRVPYTQWIREGWIQATEGNATDYNVVRRDINALADHFAMPEIAVDRLFQGAQLCTDLAADGFEVIAFGQGFLSMAAPTKRFEELVIEGKVAHGMNPVLRWMAANVAIERDAAGNMKPSKKVSTERIDGIVACVMALGREMVRDESAGRSIYESRGLLQIGENYEEGE